MSWYYANEKDEQIAASEEELQRLASRGELRSDALIWREGMRDWEAAARVKPEWFTPSGAPDHGGTQMPLTLPPPSAYQTPAGYGMGYGGMAPVTDGLAIASFVCGLVGIFLTFCYGMGIFCAIAAIIMGHISLSNIKKSGEVLQGRGLAVAGLILGYLMFAIIAVVVVIFGIAIFAGLAGAAASASP